MIRGYDLKENNNIFEIGIKGTILRIDFMQVINQKYDQSLSDVSIDLLINSKKLTKGLSDNMRINSILLNENIKVDTNTLFEINLNTTLENFFDNRLIYMEIEYK